jgi:hypothetical protein
MCRGTCTFLILILLIKTVATINRKIPLCSKNILNVHFNNIIQTRGIIARAML